MTSTTSHCRTLYDLKLLNLDFEGVIRGWIEDRNSYAFKFVVFDQLEKKRPVQKCRVLICIVNCAVLTSISFSVR